MRQELPAELHNFATTGDSHNSNSVSSKVPFFMSLFNHENTSTSAKEHTRLRLFAALKTCFTTKLFRSAKLGHFHVDKGVYIDQLYRWFLNFPSQNFLIISLEQLHSHPVDIYQCILQFLGVHSTSDDKGVYNNTRVLSRCNLFDSNELSWHCCRPRPLVEGHSQQGANKFTAEVYNMTFLQHKWLNNPNSRRNKSISNTTSLFSGSHEESLRHQLAELYRPYNEKLWQLLGDYKLY